MLVQPNSPHQSQEPCAAMSLSYAQVKPLQQDLAAWLLSGFSG